MTPGDAARVLTKAAAFDQRTIGEADVLAWHEALADLDGADALAAVGRHYATSEQRLMPAHVRRIAAEIGRERHRIEREAEEQFALEQYRAQAVAPRDRSDDVQALIAQARVDMPEGDREALRPRTVAWEREQRAHQRAAHAEANPAYDPSMPPVTEWSRSHAAPEPCWWENDQARERHAKTLLAEAGRLRPRTPETKEQP